MKVNLAREIMKEENATNINFYLQRTAERCGSRAIKSVGVELVLVILLRREA